MKRSVIIAAGGSGTRMGSTTPKQFLLLHNYPVIFHTINQFVTAFPEIQVIVVMGQQQLNTWSQLCAAHNFHTEVLITEGGAERFYSIKNGLDLATGDLIGVHDAVRPLVSENLIRLAFNQADAVGAVVPVIPVNSSLRKITFDESESVNRAEYRLVQTPQVFKSNVIKLAYEQPFNDSFTDDATVVEACGHDIVLIEGEETNIKLTSPMDLKLAELLIENQK